MLDPTFALIPAVIWAFSPIYYRVFMKKLDFVLLNLVRTSSSSAVLLLPALYYGFNGAIIYAVASGAITLTLGDTLFLLATREMGASVSTPVVYVYVLFVQLTATTVGEVIPLTNYLAAAMVVAGVFVLSRGGQGRPRAKGVLMGIGAGIAWTVGQDLVRVATDAGGAVVPVTFARNFTAAVALAVAVLATRRMSKWPHGLTRSELSFIVFVAVTDLVVGSLLFVYSISTIGVAVTVILTSISPLLTQVFSRALGKEKPSGKDMLGGVLIVGALVLAVVI